MDQGDAVVAESSGPDLQEGLEEVYFENSQTPDITKEDIMRLGEIIGSGLYFEHRREHQRDRSTINIGSMSQLDWLFVRNLTQPGSNKLLRPVRSSGPHDDNGCWRSPILHPPH